MARARAEQGPPQAYQEKNKCFRIQAVVVDEAISANEGLDLRMKATVNPFYRQQLSLPGRYDRLVAITRASASALAIQAER